MNRNRQQAVQVLAIAAIAFLAGQSSLHRAIQAGTLPVADPVFSEKRASFARFQDRHPGPPIVFLGSSRTQMSINAGTLTRTLGTPVYNFGTPAGGPATNLLYLRRLLAEGVRFQKLLLEIHPAFLTEEPLERLWLHDYRLAPGEAEQLAELGYPRTTPPQHRPLGWTQTVGHYKLPLLNRYAITWLPTPYGLSLDPGDEFGGSRALQPRPEQRARLYQNSFVQYAAVWSQQSTTG
ncbi:MAG: hypothetical protein ACRCZF_06265, partial [Gemmataceae bacterium]